MPVADPVDAESLLADEDALRALLRNGGATHDLAGGRLTPIEGGLSNRAWRLDVADGRWFVRRGHPGAARLGVDRRSECTVLQAVAAAGLAPPVLICDPAAGLLVTQFVDGQPWQADDVAQAANLQRIASSLRRLHELPVLQGVHEVSYVRQARNLDRGLPVRDAASEQLRALADAAIARLRDRDASLALCHHDLHHLNMIDDAGRLWLVDWEYAGRGDPLFDVAGFLALHQLGPDPSAAFLAAYGRLPTPDQERLGDARWLFDYVQWLWYRSRFAGKPAGPGGAADRLARRLLRCDN